MIRKDVKIYCNEDISLIENYEMAVNSEEIYDCHHRLEIDGDIRRSKADLIALDMYWNRPASELIFLTHSEHAQLHMKGPTKKGSKNPVWKGRVQCIETGKVYECGFHAEKELGITHIGRACKEGGRAGGFHWKYID